MQQTRMAYKRQLRISLLACGAALLLFGCASSTTNKLIDTMPSSIGGLPADTPERPAEQLAYPAVHDMPPPRPNTTLSAEEQVQLEKDMAAIRTRQEVITGAAPQKRPHFPPPAITPAATSNTSIY
jgi:hypothetical protein